MDEYRIQRGGCGGDQESPQGAAEGAAEDASSSKKEKKKRIEGVSHQSKSPDVRMEDETRRAATSADGPESGDREVAAFLFV